MKSTTRNILFVLLTIAIVSGNIFGQSKTNLEVLFGLMNKEAAALSPQLKSDGTKLFIDFSSPNDLRIFKNKFVMELDKYCDSITTVQSEAGTVLDFTLEKTGVKYNDTFRDGLFGNYLVERESTIGGSYNISKNGSITVSSSFNLSKVDTVKYDEISSLENHSLPFTSDEIPDEPFFSSLVEPLIAVGSAVVTILLFFTVRSK